ncbi:MAG: RnfABCDGE type electron transport complex subunit D [Ruminococcaceae bacterium]|nr:RnfABCDGE type electron transport complex subunit D [Oscillospiraceae bacterium]
MTQENEFFNKALRTHKLFLVSMLPLVGMSVYLYGLRPLFIVLIAVVMAIVGDFLNSLITGKQFSMSVLSSIYYSVTFTLLLSATTRYWIVVTGVAATLFIKNVFGGRSAMTFHPSAFGLALVGVCWPEEMIKYPIPFSSLKLFGKVDNILYDSPAFTLKNGGVPIIDEINLILGDFPGPMGTTFFVLLIGILLFLVMMRAVSKRVTVTFFLTILAVSIMFPRISIGGLKRILLEIISGSVMFSGIFIVSEPITSPKSHKGKVVYGIMVGILTMLFNRYGAFQTGVCFAVLLSNPLVSIIDGYFNRKIGLEVVNE